MSRFARENLPPGEYLAMSYYEIWLAGLEKLMAERGLVSPDEIAAGRADRPPKPVAAHAHAPTSRRCSIAAARPSARPTRRRAFSRATACAPRTSIRDPHAPAALCARACRRDRARARLPRVSRLQFASAQGENPQWLYTVRFDGRELWGAGRRSDREGLGRRLGAVSGAGVTRRIDPQGRRTHAAARACPSCRATPTARCSASRGRRRLSR